MNLALECHQCGQHSQEVTEMDNCGQPWKVIVSCNICGVASIATTQPEAERKFVAGDCPLEVELFALELQEYA